jgi:hypothetical protein
MLENHVSQLQRAMTVSAMENMALRQELVRAKKLKDSGSKSGVAEPAVLESSKSTLSHVPCILVFMCVPILVTYQDHVLCWKNAGGISSWA